MSLSVWLNTNVTEGTENTWEKENFSLSYRDFVLTVGPKPEGMFYYISGSSLLNNTSDDHHTISWGFGIQNQCFANNTNPKLDVKEKNWLSWSSDHIYDLAFSTGPDGQLPDIKAAAESCSEPGRNSSKAIQISEVRRTSDWERIDDGHPNWHNGHPETAWDRESFLNTVGGKWCVVMDPNVMEHKCPYKGVGEEVAANVSKAMLGVLSCDEGEWQTIRAPCSDASQMSNLGTLGWGAALLSVAWWIL